MGSSRMHTHLLVSVLGPDRTHLVTRITQTIVAAGCHVIDSRAAVLGNQSGALFLVRGNWNTLTKLEARLGRLKKDAELSIAVRRSGERLEKPNLLPYMVEVISLSQPETIPQVAEFFSSRDINIEELSVRTYPAAQTGAPMMQVGLTIGVPANLALAVLREDFFDFCDQLNLDAILEPVKQ